MEILVFIDRFVGIGGEENDSKIILRRISL